jgi:hypothetical protein
MGQPFLVLPSIALPIKQGVIDVDMKHQIDEEFDAWDCERIEGLNAIRMFLDPHMSARSFYRHHRVPLTPYLIERRGAWRKSGPGSSPKPKFFTYKRLLLLYMLKKKKI